MILPFNRYTALQFPGNMNHPVFSSPLDWQLASGRSPNPMSRHRALDQCPTALGLCARLNFVKSGYSMRNGRASGLSSQGMLRTSGLCMPQDLDSPTAIGESRLPLRSCYDPELSFLCSEPPHENFGRSIVLHYMADLASGKCMLPIEDLQATRSFRWRQYDTHVESVVVGNSVHAANCTVTP